MSTLAEFLNSRVKLYNQPAFIAKDPICIPHRFTHLPDIEIAGFFAAIFAWGNRTTIINKATELMNLMDNAPHQFILSTSPQKLKSLLSFKHRTFNATDLLYLIDFLQHHYLQHPSLETAFTQWGTTAYERMAGFHQYVFSLPAFPERTKKHIATPKNNSNCKRLNMYLRWMVRKDTQGVDFGIWNNISAAELICPVDVHVARVAQKLGLLQGNKSNWQAAVTLTAALQKLDPQDPTKYDFALFGLGVMEKF
jgi:uncharacterized protein (TIGR02757 family)